MAAGTPNVGGEKGRFVTSAIVTKEALFRLKLSLVFPNLANYEYQKYYGRKIGDTITIKREYYGTTYKGRKTTTANASPLVDRTIKLTADLWRGFRLEWNTMDKMLHISNFYNRYVKSHIEELAHLYDMDGAIALLNGTAQTHGTFTDGAVGTGSSLVVSDLAKLRERCEYLGIPAGGDSFIVMNPTDAAEFRIDLMGTKGESGKFASQYVVNAMEERFLGRSPSEFRAYCSPQIPYQEVVRPTGYTSAPLVNSSASLEGATEVPTDGWPVSVDGVIKAGTVVTFANCFEVQPRGMRQSTGILKQFVVTEDADSNASGQATLKISPEINAGAATTTDGEGTTVSLAAFKNCTAAPADNSAIKIVGLPAAAGSKYYRQNIAFNRPALVYAQIDIPKPASAVDAHSYRDEDTGLSLTSVVDFGIDNHEETMRFDSFSAIANIDPRLCIRHFGEAVDS